MKEMKKHLSEPVVVVYRPEVRDIITLSTVDGIGEGEFAPTRQTTDFFGNTVLVPIDDEDWE